jgi:hypothetical protein
VPLFVPLGDFNQISLETAQTTFFIGKSKIKAIQRNLEKTAMMEF